MIEMWKEEILDIIKAREVLDNNVNEEEVRKLVRHYV